MKTALTLMFLMVFAISVSAQQPRSFEILNKEAYPGDTVVVRMEPQWRGPYECLKAFNEHYSPNSRGYVFIGVPLGTKPGKEQVFRVECGRGVRLDSYIDEIIIKEKEFPKTRNIRRGKASEPPCSESLVKAIRNTYDPLSKFLPDLTESFPYTYPMPYNSPVLIDQKIDIVHHYGFIYSSNPIFPHCGVDIRLPVGTKIIAVNKGVVVLTGKFRAEGNIVIINHGLGIFSVYMHLSRIYVRSGQVVDNGTIIALSGRTGAGIKKGEEHLHFNMRIHDYYVDPLNFIDTVNQYLK